jgi:hypothetical protein
VSFGGKAGSTLPTLPMIFAARIGPTPPAPSTAQQRSGKRLPQRASERRPALSVEKTAYSSSFPRSSMAARALVALWGDRCR